MKQKGEYPIDVLVRPLQRFIRQDRSAGLVLGISVVVAMVLANTALSGSYFHLLEHKLGFVVDGKPYLEYSIHHWINDGLMATFFFVVGLELKREFIAGDLSTPRKALLPVGAALGGMLVPALIYISFNPSGPAAHGWGIPMATDIVFALGVLYLLGNRIPLSLKVFLMALAIVDDLGAVLVIAFFYTSDISIVNLLIGLGFVVVMFAANRLGVRSIIFYAVMGIGGLWTAFLLSGVHATIAAVLAAFTIPANVRIDGKAYLLRMKRMLSRLDKTESNDRPTLTNRQVDILSRVAETTKEAIPPLQRLEHAMHPFVSFVVMPVFVLANAGVSLAGINLDTLFSTNITLGVGLGLLVGKVVGVVGFTWLMVRLGIAQAFDGMTGRNLFGVGLVASIGFTMSLFVTSLAFDNELYAIQAKIGIFTASIIGGVLGYLVLKASRATR